MGWGHRKYIGCLAIASLLLLPAGAIAETTAAKAPAAPNPLGDKYDTKLPVEISSDTLEVLQQQNKAIFKGNVIAVQGKIRLNADTMIVHYKQKSDQPGQPASPAQPAPAGKTDAPGSSAQGSMGAISLIEVEGNVFMATPEESAKGDKGNYQVDEKLLHLTGDNVILTRGKNILRGTVLVYDLETGHSVLTNEGAKVGGTNGGRVRSVFVPNQEPAGGKANPKKKSTASSVLAAPPVSAPSTAPAAMSAKPAPQGEAVQSPPNSR